MADQGVAFELAEACLAHQVGNAVVQAYQRSSMLERRRPVLAAWSGFRHRQDRRQRGVDQAGRGMTRIAISRAAFDAISATLPLGSVSYENKTNERGERQVYRRNRQRLPALRYHS